ncbi:GNAT family N-acetyltransferase [Sporosarcina aquimarina]|uniref:GNAT family N-acetyltransferase n=1 Tax=Sporosarcina aquimarina TaxID=114975 RepID=UPI00203A6996|nr:GNAT family N-acetyltransferase [Sporosarcina aquimarina]MCM3757954.1 GNAT family N-acetyltransferase [Sporosarcina aquimarina]
MNRVTFEDIYNAGVIAIITDTYNHFHLPDMPLYYDSNFIEFKKMPIVSEFKKAEHELKNYHSARGQHHLKFTFPQDEPISKELTAYLNREDYEIGFLELYALSPKDFPVTSLSSAIKVLPVTASNLEEFLHLQRTIDEQFGKEFAAQKQLQHKKNFSNPDFLQLIAYFDEEVAGSVDLIIQAQTVEIDGLHVLEKMRHKGVGSQLQRWLMDRFPNKLVVLVADGEDTPREMYQRQNYKLLGYQYEAVKT